MPDDATRASAENGVDANASPFSAPQITVPKGGEAIRGIGEKFAANPATGTGLHRVPIPLIPARPGFGPQLSVTYQSGIGNGIFGMGGTLSLPPITRRTHKGIPLYGDNEGPDTFILSGAEDLVPALERDDKARWGFDEFERDGYRVERYRPGVEGLFARIERWTGLETGEAHWRSISKDNILTVYGLDAGSHIADPEAPEHVFSWLICRSYEDKGNAIVYDYAAENDCGVDLTERNRTRSANHYQKRILHGNRAPLLLDPEKPGFRPCHIELHDLDAAQWMFEVVFDYGEGHHREEPPDAERRILAHACTEAGRDWPVRRDPISSYRSGFEIRTYRLCRRVLTFHHFPGELGTESYLVRSTAFHYHEKPVGSFVTRVVQFGHKREKEGRSLTGRCRLSISPTRQARSKDPDFEDYRLEEVDEERQTNLPEGIARSLDMNSSFIRCDLTKLSAAALGSPLRPAEIRPSSDDPSHLLPTCSHFRDPD